MKECDELVRELREMTRRLRTHFASPIQPMAGVERRGSLVIPTCCEAARSQEPDYERLVWRSPGDLYASLSGQPPRWLWEAEAYYEGTDGLVDVEVTRCPWCGAALPEVSAADGDR